MLPLKPDFDGDEDIIDEALTAFRVNVYFKSFDTDSSADCTLVYLTTLIKKCLTLLKDVGEDEEKAKKTLGAFCQEPLKPITDKKEYFMKDITKTSSNGSELMRYFKECRKQICARLLDILYNPEWGTMDLKYWIALHKV